MLVLIEDHYPGHNAISSLSVHATSPTSIIEALSGLDVWITENYFILANVLFQMFVQQVLSAWPKRSSAHPELAKAQSFTLDGYKDADRGVNGPAGAGAARAKRVI
ncbi:hypothetical protein VNI00_010443 [Paramarasmius palmivorus]|uniref:Uncharacterized protein n=1 Tax=Paramarasmius palmivorus TaxID=297713 RepID=A0AAW0CIQ5_9AGAR